MALTKKERRERIKHRVRKVVKGTAERPRMSVYRSNMHIYVQFIDDIKGVTLLGVSSKAIKDEKLPKVEVATKLGELAAKEAIAKGIETVVFDRNGYLYFGRVKALAEGARKGGLKF
jgi:large subunit ribosomal protein L18